MKLVLISAAIAFLGIAGCTAYVSYQLFFSSDEKTIIDQYMVQDSSLRYVSELSDLRSSLLAHEVVSVESDRYITGHRIKRGGGIVYSIRRYDWVPGKNHTYGFTKLTIYFPNALSGDKNDVDLSNPEIIVFWSKARSYGVLGKTGYPGYHSTSEICIAMGAEGTLKSEVVAEGKVKLAVKVRMLNVAIPGCGNEKYFYIDDSFIITTKMFDELSFWEGSAVGITDIAEILRPITVLEALTRSSGDSLAN